MDQLELVTFGRRFRADLRRPIDLAIELEFSGPQPRFFAEDSALAQPLRVGRFVGSMHTGASCNCGVYTLSPHCHGTHTECVGHITTDGTHVSRVTPSPPMLALVVTVRPRLLGTTSEDRPAVCDPSDTVLNREVLSAAAQRWVGDPWQALVVRTLPNDVAKRHAQYTGPNPAPYFTPDGMRWVVERKVQSLVVDLPSLDRADDGGALLAHRTYWGLPRGVTDAHRATRGRALVTELAYVADDVQDGLYLLDLQVPAFAADAAPSRPVLYPVAEVPQ